jgi:hypothetical protein
MILDNEHYYHDQRRAAANMQSQNQQRGRGQIPQP